MSSTSYYTPEEDEIIRQHYPTATNKQLATLLPSRTERGIRVRASRLGVSKRKDLWEIGEAFNQPAIAHLTEAEKGYLAGIIDGEGCIRLSKHHGRKGGVVFHVVVSVTNTSKPLIDWLNNRLPGYCVYKKRMQGKSALHRQCYTWLIAGNRRAIAFLREIAPYLIVKRSQAEALAEGYVHLSNEERLQLFEQLRDMKKAS